MTTQCAWWRCTFSMALVMGLVSVRTRADVSYEFGSGKLGISGYTDFYCVDDFDRTSYQDREITPSGGSPLYSFTRKDRLAVNHALIDLKYNADDLRAALGLQGGTYVEKNYAAENDIAHRLYEATVGWKPTEKPLWLDAGIFASHIGLESAVSKDNWTLTRSLMAENTPYYESGLKLTYNPNPRWEYVFLVLQGWQAIGSRGGNKALGTQVQFKPREGWVINSSTYLGQSPNSRDRLRRVFHDFYVTWQLDSKWSVAFTTDLGADERSPQDRSWVGWASLTVLGRFRFDPHWAVAARIESYRDPHGLTVATGSPGNLTGSGASLNLDYSPHEHIVIRAEVRGLRAREPIFVEAAGLSTSNAYLTMSTAIWF